MNLWIRSQDKEILMKIDNINLGLDVDSNEPCRLFTFVDGAVTSFTLGIYSSKERALEVLDEIQDILKPTIYYECNESPIYDSHKEYGNDGNIYETNIYTTSSIKMEPKLKSIEVNDYVYQMPKE